MASCHAPLPTTGCIAQHGFCSASWGTAANKTACRVCNAGTSQDCSQPPRAVRVSRFDRVEVDDREVRIVGREEALERAILASSMASQAG
jgi:hypothetical protein